MLEDHTGTKQGSIYGLPIGFQVSKKPHKAFPTDGWEHANTANCLFCNVVWNYLPKIQRQKGISANSLSVWRNHRYARWLASYDRLDRISPRGDPRIGFRRQGLWNVILDLHRCSKRTKSDKNREKFKQDTQL